MAYELLSGKAWWRKIGKESFTLVLACLGLLALLWFMVPIDDADGLALALRIFLTVLIFLLWSIIEFDIIDFPYLRQDHYTTPQRQFKLFSIKLWLVLIAIGLMTIWWLPAVGQWASTLFFGGAAVFMMIVLAKNSFSWMPLFTMLVAAGLATGCGLWQPMAQVFTGLLLVALGIALECGAAAGCASEDTDYAYN